MFPCFITQATKNEGNNVLRKRMKAIDILAILVQRQAMPVRKHLPEQRTCPDTQGDTHQHMDKPVHQNCSLTSYRRVRLDNIPVPAPPGVPVPLSAAADDTGCYHQMADCKAEACSTVVGPNPETDNCHSCAVATVLTTDYYLQTAVHIHMLEALAASAALTTVPALESREPVLKPPAATVLSLQVQQPEIHRYRNRVTSTSPGRSI